MRAEFEQRGFLVRRGVVGEEWTRGVETLLASWNAPAPGPVELEAEVGYPGAPPRGAPEAGVVRRQLQVHQRSPLFARLLEECGVIDQVEGVLGERPILVLAHHNCVMTKHPRHSSDTPWHRDLRSWSFREGELVTAWIALGPETPERGGLLVIPGSHRSDLPDGAFDDHAALRPEHPAAAPLRARAEPVELGRGDLLLFHCRLLHSAARNRSGQPKNSLVFTFRRASDEPLPGTRSARGGERVL